MKLCLPIRSLTRSRPRISMRSASAWQSADFAGPAFPISTRLFLLRCSRRRSAGGRCIMARYPQGPAPGPGPGRGGVSRRPNSGGRPVASSIRGAGAGIEAAGILDQRGDAILDRRVAGEQAREAARLRQVDEHRLDLRSAPRSRNGRRSCAAPPIIASGFWVSSTAPASARYSRRRDTAKRSASARKRARMKMATATRMRTMAPPPPLPLDRCDERLRGPRCREGRAGCGPGGRRPAR